MVVLGGFARSICKQRCFAIADSLAITVLLLTLYFADLLGLACAGENAGTSVKIGLPALLLAFAGAALVVAYGRDKIAIHTLWLSLAACMLLNVVMAFQTVINLFTTTAETGAHEIRLCAANFFFCIFYFVSSLLFFCGAKYREKKNLMTTRVPATGSVSLSGMRSLSRLDTDSTPFSSPLIELQEKVKVYFCVLIPSMYCRFVFY